MISGVGWQLINQGQSITKAGGQTKGLSVRIEISPLSVQGEFWVEGVSPEFGAVGEGSQRLLDERISVDLPGEGGFEET